MLDHVYFLLPFDFELLDLVEIVVDGGEDGGVVEGGGEGVCEEGWTDSVEEVLQDARVLDLFEGVDPVPFTDLRSFIVEPK